MSSVLYYNDNCSTVYISAALAHTIICVRLRQYYEMENILYSPWEYT